MQIIQHGGTAEQTINKSKFLAWAAHCQSEQEVGAFLRAIASQHPLSVCFSHQNT